MTATMGARAIRPGVDLEPAIARLAAARAGHRPCAPVRDLLPPRDIDAAYAVQAALVARRVASGARVVGHKIGLTNPAVQRQLGVDQPDFGVLLDDMDRSASGVVPMGLVLQPKIEAEIAFVLRGDLDRESIDRQDVLAATAHVVAALEIVDSRIAHWDITIVDTVADGASSGAFVLGATPRPLDGIDLTTCAMSMWRGDELVSEGVGSDCLGDPVEAVIWLARTARRYGRPLRAGDVVLSGALGPVVPASGGDTFRAEISLLGEVSATFVPVTMP